MYTADNEEGQRLNAECQALFGAQGAFRHFSQTPRTLLGITCLERLAEIIEHQIERLRLRHHSDDPLDHLLAQMLCPADIFADDDRAIEHLASLRTEILRFAAPRQPPPRAERCRDLHRLLRTAYLEFDRRLPQAERPKGGWTIPPH